MIGWQTTRIHFYESSQWLHACKHEMADKTQTPSVPGAPAAKTDRHYADLLLARL